MRMILFFGGGDGSRTLTDLVFGRIESTLRCTSMGMIPSMMILIIRPISLLCLPIAIITSARKRTPRHTIERMLILVKATRSLLCGLSPFLSQAPGAW